MTYYSLHTHSRFSAKDALPTPQALVARAVDLGQPALGLTDHGTVAGIHDLYRACRKEGIRPFPGVESYVALDRFTKRPATYHLGVFAVDNTGWDNLIGLSNNAHRQFRYKPVYDLEDLRVWGENGMLDGLYAMTGCFFGILISALRASGWEGATNILKVLTDAFQGRVLVEVQRHNINDQDHDEEGLAEVLGEFAEIHGLPLVITNDAHHLLRNEKPIHNMLKRLVSYSDDPDDAVFPGDGYHLCSEREMRSRFEPQEFDRSSEIMDMLLKQNTIDIPELNSFSPRMPTIPGVIDPGTTLADRCYNALNALDLPAKYHTRLEEELAVINGAGFATYILLTAEVTDYMRGQDIAYNARGSASGSLVCYLTKITALDPLKWGLRFDRFLSTDRTKPPDIDLDIEHTQRQKVLQWLSEYYTCVHVGTWREMKMNAPTEEDKGSLWVKWNQYCRKHGRRPDVITTEERADMRLLSEARAYDGFGIHAAGILIAPDPAELSSIPLQYVASSKTMVTALDKHSVEAAGYVKLDILGLKTLTLLKMTEQISGMPIDDVPLTDIQALSRISKGITTGLFQLSGRAAQAGCKQLRPRKFTDIVAAMALFRPATMSSGATEEFIARRRSKDTVPKRHPLIEKHTKETYGVLLYQEQLIGVLRDMGMDADTLTKTLKAVKASNAEVDGAADVMREVSAIVDSLAADVGMNNEDLEWLEHAMVSYASYGFNKAHAVSYARIAAITAWYATHRPVAFWTSALTTIANPDNERDMLMAAIDDGVRIMRPNINGSGLGYSPVDGQKAIRRGLLTIHGVGPQAAKSITEHSPYASLADFAARVNARSVTGANALRTGMDPYDAGGVVAALAKAGAFEGLSKGEQE